MSGPTKAELQERLDAAGVPYPPEATKDELAAKVEALPPEPTEDELHERFLETYEPVLTRLPGALEAERDAAVNAEREARVQTLVAEAGLSEEAAREQVYGPDVAAA